MDEVAMLTEDELTYRRNDFANWCNKMQPSSLVITPMQASVRIDRLDTSSQRTYAAVYGKAVFSNYSRTEMFNQPIHFPFEVRRRLPPFLEGICVAFRVETERGLRLYAGLIPEYIGYGIDYRGFYPIESGMISFDALQILFRE